MVRVIGDVITLPITFIVNIFIIHNMIKIMTSFQANSEEIV